MLVVTAVCAQLKVLLLTCDRALRLWLQVAIQSFPMDVATPLPLSYPFAGEETRA